MKRRSPHLILLLAALALVACTGDREPPPCTPLEGETGDPCEGDLTQISDTNIHGSYLIGPDPWSVGFYLDFPDSLIFDGHIVVRGQFVPGTVRCDARNTRRTHPYLGLRDRDYGSGLGSILCYADLQVADYILGSGPSTLTVLAEEVRYRDRSMTMEEAEEARRSAQYLFITGGSTDRIRGVPSDGITGVETIMYLGPATDASLEVWEVFATWDLERQEDDTVVAVHPQRWYWQRRDNYETAYRSQVEITLPAFKTAAQAAHTSRLADYDGRMDEDEDTPQLVTNANNLHAFHVETGNVNHPDGPPETTFPPPCGLAVPDQANNPGLMRDCLALLEGKDTLRGTGTLNWSVDDAISDWDGITTGGTPSRVTKVEVDDEDLTGSIPAELESLSGLTHLDLSDNSLTGDIPAELGLLSNLVSVKLSGNSLTGCIPIALQSVVTNDLDGLGLPDCVE